MTQSETPLISVILPVRNAERSLPDALDSIVAQNYKNIEIIAIDDNSTDSSWKILRKHKKIDTRIRAYRNVKKYGLAITLNRSLRRAKGMFIAIMDAKDTITKNKLQKQILFLLHNPQVVAVGTQCVYYNSDNKRIGKSNFPSLHEDISQKPLHGISMHFEGIMINKYKIPKDLLKFPTRKHLFLYTDMAIKLLQYGKIANIGEYLQFHTKNNLPLETTTKHFFSLLRIWITSKLEHTSTPSFKSFFESFLRPRTV